MGRYNGRPMPLSPRISPRTRRRTAGLLAGLVAMVGAGCVERTITITSEPAGALVHLNDEEVGRTPVTVPFTFYGKYDVRVEADGYQPLWTRTEAVAQWWENIGPDIAAETIPHHKAEQHWHYKLDPYTERDPDALVDRAKQLRATLRPTTQAAQ
jgi:hypothetical protein